ncbi:MAG TPA: SRPBCC domain-containing protein [Thermoplasmata archaeon]|nr:SRPBCC domain-containing protein [Thermoplasmata archaeon]
MTAQAKNHPQPDERAIFTQPSEFETQMTRIFRGSPEKLFHIYNDPGTIPLIWDPDPTKVTVETLDFRVGGRFSIAVRGEGDSTSRFMGEFLQIIPGRRTVVRWHASNRPDSPVVETDDFEPVGSFTKVTIRWQHVSHEGRDRMAGPAFESLMNEQSARIDELLSTSNAERRR